MRVVELLFMVNGGVLAQLVRAFVLDAVGDLAVFEQKVAGSIPVYAARNPAVIVIAEMVIGRKHNKTVPGLKVLIGCCVTGVAYECGSNTILKRHGYSRVKAAIATIPTIRLCGLVKGILQG